MSAIFAGSWGGFMGLGMDFAWVGGRIQSNVGNATVLCRSRRGIAVLRGIRRSIFRRVGSRYNSGRYQYRVRGGMVSFNTMSPML